MDPFAKAAADGFARNGRAATFRPASGEPIPVTCVVHRDVELVGDYGQVSERRTIIRLLKAEVATVAKGDVIEIDGGQAHKVRSLDGDNGYVLMVAVTS